MDVTKPYEFIGFGAMDVTKPYEFIGFCRGLLFTQGFLSRKSRAGPRARQPRPESGRALL